MVTRKKTTTKKENDPVSCFQVISHCWISTRLESQIAWLLPITFYEENRLRLQEVKCYYNYIVSIPTIK